MIEKMKVVHIVAAASEKTAYPREISTAQSSPSPSITGKAPSP